MRFRIWPILTVGFSALILLIVAATVATSHQAKQFVHDLEDRTRSYERRQQNLQSIRTGIYVSSLLLRDYLLDARPAPAMQYVHQLEENRRRITAALDELGSFRSVGSGKTYESLRSEVNAYWHSLDPVLTWAPQQRQSLGYAFLRKSVLPRREAVLAMAEELEQWNANDRRVQEQEAASRLQRFDDVRLAITVLTLLLGVGVAIASIWRVWRLERAWRAERDRSEHAEQEMRRLSQQLVKTQEEERRALSRELHDEVGQMLTGLRMALVSLQKLGNGAREQFDTRLAECLIMIEQVMAATRDLAMGLRPSMLDDLGLGAALQWQARDFARRYDVPVTVNLNATLDHLDDIRRSSIYRMIQEALTNCARHARAKSIRIDVAEQNGLLLISVCDDGVGINTHAAPRTGLGLLGIEERARELGGSVTIQSEPRHGTTVRIGIPA